MDVKLLDWIVGYYVGYFLLTGYYKAKILYVSLWLILFFLWIILSKRKELWIWEIDLSKKASIGIILLNVALIIGNILICKILRDGTDKYINPMFIIAASINEEIIFRGYLFRSFEKISEKINSKQKQIKDCFVVVSTSLLFSCLHMTNFVVGGNLKLMCFQLHVAFAAGVVLGITRKHFEGIKECIWVHVLFNLAAYK